MPVAAKSGTPCLPQIAEAISSSGNLCSGQSGYSFWLVATKPTSAQLTSVCLTGTCLNLVQELQKIAGKEECVTSDGYLLYEDILTPILKSCGEAKVETPTLPPPSSSGGKGTTTSGSSGRLRFATVAVAAISLAQLAIAL